MTGTHITKTEFVRCGATGYTAMPCSGAGRQHLETGLPPVSNQVRIEVVIPHSVCESILDFLRREVLPTYAVTACVETVDVLCVHDFLTSQPCRSETPQQLQRA